jgi:hypothetical protein
MYRKYGNCNRFSREPEGASLSVDSLDIGREEICSRAEGTNTQGGPLGGTSEQSTHTKYFYEGWISSYGDELAGEYKYSLALCPSLSAKISEEQSKKSMSHATLPQRDPADSLACLGLRLGSG